MTVHLKEADVQAAPKGRGTHPTRPPRVTIGMPVFNGRDFIERATASVFAQTFGDFELIILDNASTDGTYEYALTLTRDPRLRVERNTHNIGAIGNFTKVLSLARGDYFMWAAVDDLWEPECVARLVAELDQHPAAGVAMPATQRMRGDGSTKDVVRFVGPENPECMGPLRLALELGSPRKWSFFIYGLFRRPLLQRAARYFPEGGAPDRILLAQIALHSGFRYVDEVLYQRQLHEALHEERYPDEAYSRVVAMGLRGDLHFLRSLSVSLLRSHVVPLRRKVYAPVIIARFAAMRFSAWLSTRRASTDLAMNVKATHRRLVEATRQLQKQREIIESFETRQVKFESRLEKQRQTIEELKNRNLAREANDEADLSSRYPRFRSFSVQGNTYKFLCRSVKDVRRIKGQLKETRTLNWLAQALLPADIFLDIGANVGTFAIFAASRIGPSGRVYAFEPHLANAAALLTNIETNRGIAPVQVMSAHLSDRDELSVFHYDSLSQSGARSKFRQADADGEPFDPVASELKNVCRLDTLVEAGLIPAPTVIKIDAQGLESAVIVGMEKLLQSTHAPRFIQIAARATTSEDIISRMRNAGYQPVPGGTTEPYHLDESVGEMPGNIIFAKR